MPVQIIHITNLLPSIRPFSSISFTTSQFSVSIINLASLEVVEIIQIFSKVFSQNILHSIFISPKIHS
jgi:hypothetical protein